jgi:hypothetical protein
MTTSRTAYGIAAHWSASRKHPAPAVLRQDIAEQAQSHLDHGADPEYLRYLVAWMATEQPAWFDLSLAMQMSGAPQPQRTAAPGSMRRCRCRGVLAAAA